LFVCLAWSPPCLWLDALDLGLSFLARSYVPYGRVLFALYCACVFTRCIIYPLDLTLAPGPVLCFTPDRGAWMTGKKNPFRTIFVPLPDFPQPASADPLMAVAPDFCEICGTLVGFGMTMMHLKRCEKHPRHKDN
jgi:hypothetical protein